MPTTSSGSAQRGRKGSGQRRSGSATTSATRTSTSRSSAQRSSAAKSSTSNATRSSSAATSAKTADAAAQSSGASIPVPYVTAQLHTAQISLPELPGRENLTSTVTAVRSALPSRDQLLFYSGLTAAAALSVIEWPVAAAIGIGAAVVRRSANQDHEQA